MDGQPAALDRARFELNETPLDGDGLEINREIRSSHLAHEHTVKIVGCWRSIKHHFVLITIKRIEKRNSLNVIPVAVREKEVGSEFLFLEFLEQRNTQLPKAGTSVKNEDFVARTANLETGSITAKTEVFPLGSRRRTSHAPKFYAKLRGFLSRAHQGTSYAKGGLAQI